MENNPEGLFSVILETRTITFSLEWGIVPRTGVIIFTDCCDVWVVDDWKIRCWYLRSRMMRLEPSAWCDTLVDVVCVGSDCEWWVGKACSVHCSCRRGLMYPPMGCHAQVVDDWEIRG